MSQTSLVEAAEAYTGAILATDDARLYMHRDQALPRKEVTSLSEALQQLASTICTYRDNLAFLTQPKYASTLADILQNPNGARTMQALVDALTTATSFMIRVDPLPEQQAMAMKPTLSNLLHIRVRRSGPDAVVKEACGIITTLQTDIQGSSMAFFSMFTAAATHKTPSVPKFDLTDEYQRALARLLGNFISSPFRVERDKFPSTLRIRVLNNRHINAFTSSASVTHPTFREVEETARGWVRNYRSSKEKFYEKSSLDTRRAIHETAKEVLEKIQASMQDIKLIGADGEHQWSTRTSTLVASISEVTTTIGEIQALLNSRPRIAVCGLMNTGKSTAINVLTGKPLLPVKDTGSTTWPTIVEHDENYATPELTIDPLHFKPCLDAIKDWNIPRLLQPDGVTISTEQQEMLARYLDLPKDLQARVLDFSKPNFDLPEISATTNSIFHTNYMISDLLRVCKLLSPPGEQPKPSNTKFPRLKLKFSELGNGLTDMEFIDLPGYDDEGVTDGDIEDMYRIAMEECHGVLLVQKAIRSALGSRSEKNICSLIRKYLPKAPKAILGTYRETHDSDTWKAEDPETMAKTLYPRQRGNLQKSNIERIVCCSPPLYMGALFAQGLLQEAKEKGQEVSWDEVYREGGKMCIDWHFGKTGKEEWPRYPHSKRLDILSKAETTSNMVNVPDHLKRFLMMEARDLECLNAMITVRDALRDLWKNQQDVLDKSKDDGDSLEAAKKACQNFEKIFGSSGGKWNGDQEPFNRKISETMNNGLRKAKQKAEIAFEDILEEILDEYDVDHETITFATSKDASKFVDNLSLELKKQLDSIQIDLVSTVRKDAEAAWQTRIKGLASFIRANDEAVETTSLEESLKAAISVKLEELSNQRIDAAVMNRVLAKQGTFQKQNPMRKLLLEYRSPWRPRQLAEAAAVKEFTKPARKQEDRAKAEKKAAKKNIAILEELSEIRLKGVQVAGTTDTKTVEQIPTAAKLSQQEAEDLYVKSVNYLGFLLRAPVMATIVECRSTNSNWSFLKSKSDADIGPVQLEIGKVREIFTNYLKNVWGAILEQEAWQSLHGAIDLSGRLGMNLVLDFVTKEKERLENLEKDCKEPLTDREEEQLIVLQANFVGAYAAADELCQLLTTDYAKIW
ncbi:hypothetical protein FRC17_010088 [Serendipita sp. 399]|nr:hypothetical protein FRC17_010088 [Serendipita sp. 399]